jgi:small subunit ribosomal protein S3
MGRKVHPIGFRLGYIKDWQSRWYADRNYAELLHEDRHIRDLVHKELDGAGVSRVEIERAANKVEVTIHTAKPGVVIGKRGQNVDVLKSKLEKLSGKKIKLNISEIHQPELDAQLVAESIAEQITKRVSFKRAMKQATQRAMRLGAEGIMVKCSGRLGGAEMARFVYDMQGRIPRHTLRADIDYAVVHAHTTYGRIGVKVWIYKGEVFPRADGTLERAEPARRPAPVQADEGRGRGDRGRGRGAGGNDGGGRGRGGRGGRGTGGQSQAPQTTTSDE